MLNAEGVSKVHNVSEHSDEDKPSTSKCGLCEYTSDDSTDFDVHVKSNHEFRCGTCSYKFKSEKKLKDHMCRVNILNPEFGQYYMKNWILADGCTRVFSKTLGEEVLFLHSQQCIKKLKSCPDLLSYYDIDMVNMDGKIWHAAVNNFISEGKVNWHELGRNFNIR